MRRFVDDERYLQAALKAGDFIMRNQYDLSGETPRPRADIRFQDGLANCDGAFLHTRFWDEKQQSWIESPRDIGTFYGVMALEKILATKCE